jgi:hypothetical protein
MDFMKEWKELSDDDKEFFKVEVGKQVNTN